MARSVDEAFPHLTAWVTTQGWVGGGIGYDDSQRDTFRKAERSPVIDLPSAAARIGRYINSARVSAPSARVSRPKGRL